MQLWSFSVPTCHPTCIWLRSVADFQLFPIWFGPVWTAADGNWLLCHRILCCAFPESKICWLNGCYLTLWNNSFANLCKIIWTVLRILLFSLELSFTKHNILFFNINTLLSLDSYWNHQYLRNSVYYIMIILCSLIKSKDIYTSRTLRPSHQCSLVKK